jgi:hypothetical protein
LDIKDKGNTNAALPTITKPNIIALKAIGFLGLNHRGKGTLISCENKWLQNQQKL